MELYIYGFAIHRFHQEATSHSGSRRFHLVPPLAMSLESEASNRRIPTLVQYCQRGECPIHDIDVDIGSPLTVFTFTSHATVASQHVDCAFRPHFCEIQAHLLFQSSAVLGMTCVMSSSNLF